MATMKVTYKKLQELHKMLGGNTNGFFITCYGNDLHTGTSINIDERIARFERPSASADYYLVKGKAHTKR